ncbi:MAG: phosphoribosyl 1,2-cyclic phosphodiesterase [Candidatus Marinamargulisbacteria bacterium]
MKFWGVRGSIPTPGELTVEYGGNTPCVEICLDGQLFVVDCGSGCRALGNHLLSRLPIKASLFFSHYHWDHIQGFPFFTPVFMENNAFDIYGPETTEGMTTRDVLSNQMKLPWFPVPLENMNSAMTFHTFHSGDQVQIGGVTVTALELNHTKITLGYRFASKDFCVSYISDTEHFEEGYDPNVIALAKDADVVVYDAMYNESEYKLKKGWGHSTWEQGVKVAKESGCKQFFAFHHDPVHSDAYMRKVSEAIAAVLPGGMVAKEGMRIDLK